MKTKIITRAGITAALYTVVTLCFAPFAYGPLQIRPAEALTVLPMFFAESPYALFIGCMLANILSSYGILDVVFGSLITLVAGILTRVVAKKIDNPFLALIFPVVLNAVGLPIIFLLTGATEGYIALCLPILLTQSIFIYGLGIPLYYAIKKLQKKVDFLK